MHQTTAQKITTGGIIAALYIVLTMISHALGLAGGQIQLRLSEALCVLPVFTGAAVPGLFVGCLLANILTGAALPDILFGSLATLAAAYLSFALSRTPKNNAALALSATLPAIVVNSLVIPFVLTYVYGLKPLLLNFATVSAGEILSAGVLGFLLFHSLRKSAAFSRLGGFGPRN